MGKMGKLDRASNVFIGVTAAVAFAFTTGCGDPSADGSEPISTSEAAFSQSACATAPPDGSFTGGIDPSIVTPRTYNTCYKGYVVDIINLDDVYTWPGNAADGRIEIAYGDDAITNQATCEATELRMMVYNCVAEPGSTTGPIHCGVLYDQSSYGTWAYIFGTGQCFLGPLSLSGLAPGGSYRVAATARSPSSATRKINIGTYPPINVE